MGAQTVIDGSLGPYLPRSRHHRQERRWLWLVGGVAALCAAGVGAWYARPRVVFAPSRTALVAVRMQGLGTRVVAASVRAPGLSRAALRVLPNGVWPTRSLAPGARMTVDIRTKGLFGWTGQDTVTVLTPSMPRLSSRAVTTDIGARPEFRFDAAVAEVQVGSGPVVAAAHGATDVVAGPPAAVPGERERLSVRARARTWEAFGAAQTVEVSSVPWLHVTAVTASTGPSDPAAVDLRATFSAPVTKADLAAWQVQPNAAGSWHRVTDRTWVFEPAGAGFAPDSPVTLRIPGGTAGPRARTGSYLQSVATLDIQVPQATTERVQEWLAELGYLPVTWTPDRSGTGTSLPGWQSAYDPPAGTFKWRYPDVPASLKALWSPVDWTVITQGAVMAFERHEGLPVNGILGSNVWAALRTAVAKHQVFQKPYAYVRVSENLPERLWLWVGGRTILSTLANTGVPKDATAPGTYPVDLRLTHQVMRGKNPNGTRYASPVNWINYFHGSEAVHGYVRAQYGFPQSDGCVEVPPSVAKKIYPHLYVGALVTVEGPETGQRSGTDTTLARGA